jgi:ABC-type multidrug transport system, ATPase component
MQLELKNIAKSFESKTVLKDINFTFEDSKIYALLGRNGAGKTTLFNCLSSELEPDHGTAMLNLNSPASDVKRELSVEDIGYVYSTPILPDFLTGYEFIRFYIDINKKTISSDKTIADYFDLVKISQDDQHRLIKDYSHGMKNKLQMLCYFITQPPVLLLDEPLTSLDVVVALEFKKLLRENRTNRIIIFSTHILQLATDLCDEIIILSEGQLKQVDHQMLKSSTFEDEIIELLKEV